MFDSIHKLPVLDIGNKMGATEYIDFIREEDMTAPIMRGFDCFSRPFLVFHMKMGDQVFLETVFKRYSSYYDKCWMSCGHATPNLIQSCGGMRKAQFDFFQELIDGKSPTLTEDHIPSNNDWVGNTVSLLN